MKKILLIIGILGLVFISYFQILPIQSKTSTDFYLVYIDGNSKHTNETQQWEYYDFQGDGTKGNPYIVIPKAVCDNPQGIGRGIHIENTNRYFIIEDVVIDRFCTNAIELNNVTHAEITNVNAMRTIVITNTTNLVMTNNTCFYLRLENTNNSIIENNLINSEYIYGLKMYYSNNNTIQNNIVKGLNPDDPYQSINGIYLEKSDNNTILDNTIINPENYTRTIDMGIFLNQSNSNVIKDNNGSYSDISGTNNSYSSLLIESTKTTGFSIELLVMGIPVIFIFRKKRN